VPHLRTERHAELDALGVERVVAAVVRRKAPEPWDDAQALEAELANGAPKLATCLNGMTQVD